MAAPAERRARDASRPDAPPDGPKETPAANAQPDREPNDAADEDSPRERVGAAAVSPSRSSEPRSDALDPRRASAPLADAADPAADPATATATVDCPPGFVGRVIGKGGETIKGLQAQSGARIAIDQNFPEGVPRKISISGPRGCVATAVRLVEELLRGGGGRRLGGGVGPGQAQTSVRCPKEMVGRVIGRGGETVKGLQAVTGARIQIDQSATPCVVTITGNPSGVDLASRAVADVVRGGSTAAYGEANRRAAEARFALAQAAMYGGVMHGAAGAHATHATHYPYARAPYVAAPTAYGPRDAQMAQLEHQFASMGYGHPGGRLPTQAHIDARYGSLGFGRGARAYGYAPVDAYGGYGGDLGALYAMHAAQMQSHMMPPGPGGAGGAGGGGVPSPGDQPLGPGPGDWVSREPMAHFQPFQQDAPAAQAPHAGASAQAREARGARNPASGKREFAPGMASGEAAEGDATAPAGAEPAAPSSPVRPRSPESDAAWTSPQSP